MKASTLWKSSLDIEFGGVFEEVSDGVSCPFDSSAAMGPPSLFIWFGKSQALGEPNHDVIVKSAALLKLGHPDVVKPPAAAFQPLPDALEEF